MKLTQDQKITLISAVANGFCANPNEIANIPSELVPLIMGMVDRIIIELEEREKDGRD